ncbi:MAG: phosphatidylglycerol lysyltransferase domain-containing protein [Coxiellaceae bacterium]|nr:phosphatidylglycerol lysyltransferase domain-containing protein [Coxiellaceae bacterium]
MQWRSFERQHKKLLDSYLGSHGELSGINYSNFLLWQHVRHYQLARHQQHLFVRYRHKQQWCYFFPFSDDTEKALYDLMSQLNQSSIYFNNLNSQQLNQLCATENINVETHQACRDNADYVYLIQDLIDLKGQAYRTKRNFCHQFDSHYDPVYQEINAGNLSRVYDFLSQWFVTVEEENEWRGICYFLENYHLTDCLGGMLLVDNQVVAVTFGEVLNQDTVVIHIEKANTQYRGAYQAINRYFLQQHWSGFTYVNRQQDLGMEGLRKAKMSYHPVRLIDKYSVQVTAAIYQGVVNCHPGNRQHRPVLVAGSSLKSIIRDPVL